MYRPIVLARDVSISIMNKLWIWYGEQGLRALCLHVEILVGENLWLVGCVCDDERIYMITTKTRNKYGPFFWQLISLFVHCEYK